MRRNAVFGAVIACDCLVSPGCHIDTKDIEDASRMLSGQMDKSTGELLKTIIQVLKDAKTESREFRDTLERMGDQYKITTQDLPLRSGTQLMGFVDFLLNRLRSVNGNVAVVRSITLHLRRGEYQQAIVDLRKLESLNHVAAMPQIVDAVPSSVSMVWTSKRKYKVANNPEGVIKFGGYNHRLGDRGAYRIEIRGGDDAVLREDKGHFTIVTDYLAQADIARGSGIKFKPDDRSIVLLCDGKLICQVPITWGERIPDPVPHEVVVNIGNQGPWVPPHKAYDGHERGDPEFNGAGPKVNLAAEIRTNENRLETRLYMSALEWDAGKNRPEDDYTYAEGWSPWQVAYQPPGGTRILEIRSPAVASAERIDGKGDHSEKTVEFPGSSLVHVFRYISDTEHHDDAGVRTCVRAEFNQVRILVLE